MINTTMHIHNVHFNDNSAGQGGAMSLLRSNVTITSCKFSNNYALIGGGSISSRTSTLTVNNSDYANNYVVGNIATHSFGEGGAILYVGENNQKLSIHKGDFTNNSVPESGGAIHVQTFDHVLITDTIFKGNQAKGNGVCLVSSSACNVRGGGATFLYRPRHGHPRNNFHPKCQRTFINSQNAEGGAVFTTSAYNKLPVMKMSKYVDCTFPEQFGIHAWRSNIFPQSIHFY